MAATPEELDNALAIISENLSALDKEQKKTARGFNKLLAKKYENRTPFYEAVTEKIRQNRRISVEEMAHLPAAPKKSDRNTRGKAIKLTQERLGVSIEQEGNFYVIREDLSEHVAWFIEKNRLTEAEFKANCTQRGVAVEATKSALRAKGVKFSNQGEMIV